nr:unnamed protein product [Callosobruchus analis]
MHIIRHAFETSIQYNYRHWK